MDLEFWSILLQITLINLVLAGDNAIVIALAVKGIEPKQRKLAIGWGTAGAIIVRVVLTLLIVWVLKIPYLTLFGGLFLIWIAYKLLADNQEEAHVKSGQSLNEAIRTIIIADTVMGIDNTLAIAGAAKGSFFLIIIGLIISIPIIVAGSQLILKLLEKYPRTIYVGAAILAYTAAEMILNEKALHTLFTTYSWTHIALPAVVVIGTLIAGKWKIQLQQKRD